MEILTHVHVPNRCTNHPTRRIDHNSFSGMINALEKLTKLEYLYVRCSAWYLFADMSIIGIVLVCS